METKDLFLQGGRRNKNGGVLIDAATVILLRDGGEGPYEVFFMRRHGSQSFMGGAHVFPGGRLDDADADTQLADCIGGMTAADARRLLQEPGLSDSSAVGFFTAAIRETFEEAGVLLARDGSGRPLELADSGTFRRFDSYRLEIHDKLLTMA